MGAQDSKLSPVDIQDLADKTDFTEREIEIWFKSFKNDCPTGKLNVQDFKKLYNQLFPGGDVTAFAQHAFRTFDNNNDGTIDFREFLTALSMMSRGTFESKLSWAFSMYDQDKDGYVTKQEMLEIINAMYKMVGEKAMSDVINDGVSAEARVDRIFGRMDNDGDQKITLEEFNEAALADPSLVMLLQVGSK